MTQPKGLIQHINARCYELYKNGVSVEEISEEVGIPQLLVKKSIRRIKMNEKLKEKTMNELIKLVEQWSKDKNLDQGNSFSQFAKSAEELGEVASALCRNDKDLLRDGIGDVVVTLIILAQQNGMDLHECLNTAYDEIKGRTGVTTEDGRFIKESDL